MMYRIHGHEITYIGGECGIYKSPDEVQRMEYSALDMEHLVQAINGMPYNTAVEQVTKLRDRAALQTKWQHTPQNPGFPVLRQRSEPRFSIDEVRDNIRNTQRFLNDVLAALQGR